MPKRYFIFLFMLFGAVVHSAENLSDHEQFCQASSISCLDYINQHLAVMPPGSTSWFKVKAYQLDYLFDKHQFAELEKQTTELLALEKFPEGFAVQLYFYHAKMLFLNNNLADAHQYAALAVAQLDQAYQHFGSPLRLIELANLHYSLKDTEQAEMLLDQAAARYNKSKDPLFWFEWYSNKAILQDVKQQNLEAARLRRQALLFALSLNQNGKIIVGYGNLARTEQLLQNYDLAYSLYEQSLAYMTTQSDDLIKAIHLLRMAEISWQSGNFQQSVILIKQIDPQLLGEYHLQVLQQLKDSSELSARLIP